MANKKEPVSVSLSKLILAVSVIVCIGALFGAVGYLMSRPQQIIVPIINPKNDERCNQKAKVSETCSAVGFEFNSNEGKCVVVNGAGCIDNLPFGALEECQNVCEIKTETKSAVVGEDFLITLDANPSTGYLWEADFDENYLMLRSKDFVFDSGAGWVGKSGKEVFTFAPIKAGETAITMNYGRSWKSKPSETKVFKYNIKEKTVLNQDVSVATDKTEYEQGENIKIVVNNGLDKSILYSGWGGRFWDVQYFKDGKWINSNNETNGSFQLTEKNIGDACNILLYERAYPVELSSQSNLTAQWNQKICPFTENPYIYKSIVRYIESGKYRLVFYYGFEVDSNDEFRISDSKTVYSNEFIIK